MTVCLCPPPRALVATAPRTGSLLLRAPLTAAYGPRPPPHTCDRCYVPHLPPFVRTSSPTTRHAAHPSPTMSPSLGSGFPTSWAASSLPGLPALAAQGLSASLTLLRGMNSVPVALDIHRCGVELISVSSTLAVMEDRKSLWWR
jgi:hypothetical protein